jgi:hypothetical protein
MHALTSQIEMRSISDLTTATTTTHNLQLVGKMTTIVFPSGKKLNIVISTYMHDAEMIKAQKEKGCGNVQVVHTTHKSCFHKS